MNMVHEYDHKTNQQTSAAVRCGRSRGRRHSVIEAIESRRRARAEEGVPVGSATNCAAALSTAVSLGNLLFISSVLCRTPGDIKAHTEFALGDLKRQLEVAGSSMENKCHRFPADIRAFAAMNFAPETRRTQVVRSPGTTGVCTDLPTKNILG